MHYFIGLDIGTTHTKAVIATADGTVTGEKKISYPSFHPLPGYHEQDPLQIYQAVIDALHTAISLLPDPKLLHSISLSAAMHSLVAVDRNGSPLTPLITWADTRSIQEAQTIRSSQLASSLYEETGTPVHPMSPLCKLCWMQHQLPAVFVSAYKFVSIKEFIWHKLFDEWIVDHSIASATGLFNIRTKQWSPLALQTTGITAERLSIPVPANYKKPRPVSMEALHPSTIFLVGGSDGFLANLGSGAVGTGEMALTIGTSGAVRVLRKDPLVNPRQALFQYATDEEHYLTGGPVNNGGYVLQWFTDTFLQGRIEGWMEKAASVPAGSDGLLFLPYILGERAPVWDAAATGMFAGIKAQHTTAHFLRAVLEGVAFAMKQLTTEIESTGETVSVVFASGGFIASPLWTQIVTDVLNKQVNISHAADSSALGAIFLGMREAGIIHAWQDVKKFIATDEVLVPDVKSQSAYATAYSRFGQLYEKFRSIN